MGLANVTFIRQGVGGFHLRDNPRLPLVYFKLKVDDLVRWRFRGMDLGCRKGCINATRKRLNAVLVNAVKSQCKLE